MILHIKRVDRRAFFSKDFGKADVQTEFAERVGNCVEQPHLIFGLHFHNGPAVADFIIKPNERGDVDFAEPGHGTAGGPDFFQDLMKFDGFLVGQRALQHLFRRLNLLRVGHGLKLAVTHLKLIEHHMVPPRVNVGAEHLQLGRRESAGNFRE